MSRSRRVCLRLQWSRSSTSAPDDRGEAFHLADRVADGVYTLTCGRPRLDPPLPAGVGESVLTVGVASSSAPHRTVCRCHLAAVTTVRGGNDAVVRAWGEYTQPRWPEARPFSLAQHFTNGQQILDEEGALDHRHGAMQGMPEGHEPVLLQAPGK